MKDRSFTFYCDGNVYTGGIITDGSLRLESEVWGEEYDSERYTVLTKDATDMLFSKITFKDFIALGKEEGVYGIEELMDRYGIKYITTTI